MLTQVTWGKTSAQNPGPQPFFGATVESPTRMMRKGFDCANARHAVVRASDSRRIGLRIWFSLLQSLSRGHRSVHTGPQVHRVQFVAAGGLEIEEQLCA